MGINPDVQLYAFLSSPDINPGDSGGFSKPSGSRVPVVFEPFRSIDLAQP